MSQSFNFGSQYERAKQDDRLLQMTDIDHSTSKAVVELVTKNHLGNENCFFQWDFGQKNAIGRLHLGWCHIEFETQKEATEALWDLLTIRMSGKAVSVERVIATSSHLTLVSMAPVATPTVHPSQPDSFAIPGESPSRPMIQPTTSPLAQATITEIQTQSTSVQTITSSLPNVEAPSTVPFLDLDKLQSKWVLDAKNLDHFRITFYDDYSKLKDLCDERNVTQGFVMKRDAEGMRKFHARHYPSYCKRGDEMTTVLVAMTRSVSLKEAQAITIKTGVPEGKQVAFMCLPPTGDWQVWDQPNPAIDNHKDRRSIPFVEDSFEMDGPHHDTARMFKNGIELIREMGILKGWNPGQLIGSDGAHPEVQASTVSLSGRFLENGSSDIDDRTPTMHGFVNKYWRPIFVGAGWGDYDAFAHWQLHGRQVKPDMVVEKCWITDAGQPFSFCDENGNTELVHESLSNQMNLRRSNLPVSLYERLNGNANGGNRSSRGWGSGGHRGRGGTQGRGGFGGYQGRGWARGREWR